MVYSPYVVIESCFSFGVDVMRKQNIFGVNEEILSWKTNFACVFLSY